MKIYLLAKLLITVTELPYYNVLSSKPNSYRLRVDAAQLFKEVAGIAASSWVTGSAGLGLATAKAALSVVHQDKDTPEQRVYKLFFSAIEMACLYNFTDQAFKDYLSYPHQTKALAETIRQQLTTIEITLTAAMFTDLQQHQLVAVAPILEAYESWLVNVVHLSQDTATLLRRAVDRRLLDFLNMEWARKPEYYEVIIQHLNTPFSAQRLQRGRLLNYYEELKQRFHQPALGDELLPLSSIYQ